MTASYCRARGANWCSRPGLTSITETERRAVSDAANDLLQKCYELALDTPRGFHHLGVIERLRQHARRHVGDAGDAEHFQVHVPGDNRLWNRRHADRVCTDQP